MDVSFVARVPAPASEVREFVADLRNLPKWDSTAKLVSRVGADESGVYDVTFKLSRSTPQSIVRYTIKNGQNNTLIMDSKGAHVETHERVTFEALKQNETTVVWEAYIKFKGVAACFAPCLGNIIRHSAERAQRGLVQYFIKKQKQANRKINV